MLLTGNSLREDLLAEDTFLQQELNYCHPDDTITRNSLTQAIQSFEDALFSQVFCLPGL
ncbi:hypothetical protein FACS189485_11000 [Spirochaetia bacterium]|nr:hypothetical protein FACS189485_11000 [Spirochaetia bacterium]